MAVQNITGAISDAAGGSQAFSVQFTTDQVTITSITGSPINAAPGTTRTLTIVATSSSGSPLSATINPVPGITFTPLTGQPAGTFSWQFVL